MLAEKIIGKRVTIERMTPNIKMAETIYTAVDRSREHLLPWLGWVNFTNSPNDSLDFLEKTDAEWTEEKQFVYAIYNNNTKDFIGIINALNVSKEHKKTEIGYWLDIKFVGKGYMQEAVKLLEQELWRKGFNRLVIHTDVLNEKSANVAKSLGYYFEGIKRQDCFSKTSQCYRDINIFSKLKSDNK